MHLYLFPPEMLELGFSYKNTDKNQSEQNNQRHRRGKSGDENGTEPLWLIGHSNNNSNLRNEGIFGKSQMKIQPASVGLRYLSLVSFLFGLFVCFGL